MMEISVVAADQMIDVWADVDLIFTACTSYSSL